MKIFTNHSNPEQPEEIQAQSIRQIIPFTTLYFDSVLIKRGGDIYVMAVISLYLSKGL